MTAVWAGGTARLVDRDGERDTLDRLIDAVREGESRVLVLRGEPGVGKTALMDYLATHARGCQVARALGVQSEMELPFSSLHQLVAPMLDEAEDLPVPQRDALRTVFGRSSGPAPDRFLVALAVLSLLSEVAGERPLICLVDDAQWLDHASAQTLGFAARRLAADPVGLVFSTRVPSEELAGLPELMVTGLHDSDARVLLDSVLAGPVDARVRDQIVSESEGNPLALLELPRALTPAELAGGFGLPGAVPLSGRIEESFRRQLEALPAQTRRLLQLAAADPSGDSSLVWRAAERLGIPVHAGAPAVEAGLAEFGERVRFRHPMVRSAAYWLSSAQERWDAHSALAAVTDPAADPDRRAWHRAQAATRPDEETAAELERSAGRALDRGGLAAAAAFLERAALLTPEPVGRTERLIAAARAKRDAGALDAALGLLTDAEAGPLDAMRTAEIERLRGQIASDQRRDRDAARLLLTAARLFEPVNVALARETHLEALWEALMWTGDLSKPDIRREAVRAARAAPRAEGLPGPVDVLLDAIALRFTEGYTAAAPGLSQALELFRTLDVRLDVVRRWLWLTGGRAGAVLAMELWDFESLQALAARNVQVARNAGALLQLRFAMHYAVLIHILRGELIVAARLLEEDRLIAEMTGPPAVGFTTVMLASWRGDDARASELINTITQDATTHGQGMLVNFAMIASAVLHNGLGRYDAARDAARQAFQRDHMGFGSLVVPELAEAAARTGDAELVRAVLEWLSERTSVTPTEWALATEARVRALLSDDDIADRWYRESIERFGRTELRAQLARSHLLYGEWLRRERRLSDARQQLRMAHRMLDAMGIMGFAERAMQELLAAGEAARIRVVPIARTGPDPVTDLLTAQEAQVARLAQIGLSNPEIAARLFISARTVQYHLSRVFTKLGISSRSQLDRVLPRDPEPLS